MFLIFFKHYLLSKRAGSFIKMMSWISVLGIAFSIMSLVVIASIMNGFGDSLRDKMIAAEPHLLVQNIEKDQLSKILESFETQRIESFEKQELVIKTLNGYFGWALGEGLDSFSISEYVKKFNSSDEELSQNEVIIGESLAKELEVFEGDQILLTSPEALLLPLGEVPKMSSVIVKKILLTGIENVDRKLLIYDRNEGLGRLRETGSYEKGYRVFFKDPEVVDEAKKKIQSQEGGSNILVETWKDRNSALILALNLEKVTMTTFLSIAALITCFSIISVLTLLLTQKKQDIAIMRVLGFPTKSVKKLFLKIGLMLCLMGLGGGIFLGVIVSLILGKIELNVLPDFYYSSSIPSELNLAFIGFVILGSILVAFVSSWLPIRFNLQKTLFESLKK